MPSFISLAAFASLAFAAIGSALPAGPVHHQRSLQGTTVDIALNPRYDGSHHIDAQIDSLSAGVGGSHTSTGYDLSSSDVNTSAHVSGVSDVADDKTAVLPDACVEAPSAYAHTTPRDLSGVVAVGSAAASLSGSSKTSRSEIRTLPVILTELNGKITPLCEHLGHSVSADADADANADVSIPILEEIKIHLAQAQAEIQNLVSNPVEGVYSLRGKVLSIHAIAQLYATLITTIVVALGLVAKIVGTVKTEIILGLVGEIAVILAAIISLGIQLAGDLLTHLVPLVNWVVPIIFDLSLGSLIHVLGLSVKTAY